MFITPAYAQAGGGGGGFEAFIPLILIFVVFYFLLIRPQQKKAKEHKARLDAIRRGDRVVVGGILGTVSKVNDNREVDVEIAQGVKIKVLQDMVADVLSKTEPVKGGGKPADTDAPANDGPVKKPGGLRGLLGGKK
ncbi:preprotein translocase subunit YajC [Alphaproteobacteria bacterium HT1-32]|nr:preprotein translocase subunit YajC [Alphaproteobacteria bacterium HT1-32]|tara:strand:- start:58465 stop:58872 length:408 start_codon:yes stop_codon:yes gene_type:complete